MKTHRGEHRNSNGRAVFIPGRRGYYLVFTHIYSYNKHNEMLESEETSTPRSEGPVAQQTVLSNDVASPMGT